MMSENVERATDERWVEMFVSNIYSENSDEILTAPNNQFYNGQRTLAFSKLVPGIEGIDLLMTKNLTALLGYEDELQAGKQVDVYVRYIVNADRSAYEKVDVLRVDVREQYYD